MVHITHIETRQKYGIDKTSIHQALRALKVTSKERDALIYGLKNNWPLSGRRFIGFILGQPYLENIRDILQHVLSKKDMRAVDLLETYSLPVGILGREYPCVWKHRGYSTLVRRPNPQSRRKFLLSCLHSFEVAGN